ncbi:SigE family RNA polymerase sigma factor [Dactylosporangium darangshiense]|uniref:SigE family RNA polymerase sigma factor n=1 Tax=Dactylosporangium darangshiense TaxID=579108 RepID=A0ABP8CYI2_9ACTN
MRGEDERRYVEYVSARLPWIRKVAFLLCQDWHRADDITQVAITKLYTHWRRAAAADNLDGYVRTVVVRVFLSERRTGWASRVDLRAEPLDEAAAAEADPALRLAMREALAEVPPRQRAALVLRYYCDLSVEETAEALGCSAGTVKSQTARGQESLRKALDARHITVEA